VATKTTRPGRVIIFFFVVLGAMFGGVAAAGDWGPRLGLDLQGGTRITLQALTEEGDTPPEDQMEEAKGIIEQRVNGTGVTESEVALQGGNQIVVEIPGEEKQDIVSQVGETAKLYFRLTWAAQPAPDALPIPSTPAITLPPEPQDTQPTDEESPTDDATNNRAVPGFGSDPSDDPSDDPTDDSTTGTDQTGQDESEPGDGVDWSQITQDQSVEIANSLTESNQTGTPPAEYADAFNALVTQMNEFDCPPGGAAPNIDEKADQPLITCDEQGGKYLLSPSLIEGTQVTDASATIPQQGVSWQVQLELDGAGSDTMADVSSVMAGNRGATFAIVLDSQVISSAFFEQTINNGEAQISGDFTQAEAQSLANSLKYGALPLDFRVDGVTVEGPSLAGNQLNAGLLAGAFGLALVIAYCMVYYRGLGIVVVASLGVAAAMTYAMVLLLGAGMGFALTLPGVAGLIVAVGITADSFIIYFERIRDEVRDGKSLRLAVEAGWSRAFRTLMAADAVSFLAALVLYIFAIGVVRGFAFALGLATLIDVFVTVFFTKPLVSMLVRTRFFGQGHRLSGFDTHHLGIEGRSVSRMATTARGEA
jgi:preprotein translocase subunit SecD